MKLIEVIADAGSADTIAAIAEQNKAADFRQGLTDPAGMQALRLLAADDRVQPVLDALQGLIGQQPGARIHVIPVDVALPKPHIAEQRKEDAAVAAREALHSAAERDSRLNLNYVVLVALSTVVAAIGLVENNVAVVIGAMVIAPLLGPNMAFGLATALGDLALMRKSLVTLMAGIAIALGLAVLIGYLWPFAMLSAELMARTDVGVDSVALALASGAAAALSLTTGLSSVLVGVMVAVALLPPAAACGLLLGHGLYSYALGAGLLLAVNIVCVNLACKIVFWLKGVAPRTWGEQKVARRAMRNYVSVWILTLMLLGFIIYLRGAVR